LYNQEDSWPNLDTKLKTENITELKSENICLVSVDNSNLLNIENFDSYTTLIRSTALFLRSVDRFKSVLKRKDKITDNDENAKDSSTLIRTGSFSTEELN
jgi:hypothetical protein